ncbi:conserved hypothetical protein [Culex quinquefasciatus]|uniref:Uncharacterized protein n=1 Tax=Culex quinquefasciatus TaxID=7176 RepID=B0X2E8_CULQU|nr:conserved hypothetical protein [Culex quinquefasciatus]|eukprot:XP_001863820.1 conserved hypothetical protein [Culex quinquefasciatus]
MLVTLISMACCGSVRRKAPMNFIFLTLFTLAQSFLLGITTARAAVGDYHQRDDGCRTLLQPEVMNRIVGMFPTQVRRRDLCGVVKTMINVFLQIVKTIVKKLDKTNLPVYPPLPVNLVAKKIMEKRRT